MADNDDRTPITHLERRGRGSTAPARVTPGGTNTELLRAMVAQHGVVADNTKAVERLAAEQAEVRADMAALKKEIQSSGAQVLEAIRVTAETSAVRERETLDNLTKMSTLAVSGEERERRREERELEEIKRRHAREDKADEWKEREHERSFENKRERDKEIAGFRKKMLAGLALLIGALFTWITVTYLS